TIFDHPAKRLDQGRALAEALVQLALQWIRRVVAAGTVLEIRAVLIGVGLQGAQQPGLRLGLGDHRHPSREVLLCETIEHGSTPVLQESTTRRRRVVRVPEEDGNDFVLLLALLLPGEPGQDAGVVEEIASLFPPLLSRQAEGLLRGLQIACTYAET